MRKLFLSVALVTAAIAATVAMAGATTATRFSAIHATKSIRPVRHHGRFVALIERGRLMLPANHRVTLGHTVAKIGLKSHRPRVRIRIVASFPGQGSLKALGVISRGQQNRTRLPIIGGTGAFNGAAGKLNTGRPLIRFGGTAPAPRRPPRWTFIFVQ